MPAYAIEVEPIVVTQLTGRLGTAVATYRGHVYRIALGGSEVSRDGKPCPIGKVPPTVYTFAVRQYEMLVREYRVGEARRAASQESVS